jgi:hypothetical protein
MKVVERFFRIPSRVGFVGPRDCWAGTPLPDWKSFGYLSCEHYFILGFRFLF